MRKKLAACLACLAALAACAEPHVTGPLPAQSTARPPGGAGAEGQADAGADAAAVAAAEAPEPIQSWVDAVRLERWDDAAQRIDALADGERGLASVRYARARAALALGDFGKAVELLHGLEKELPVLSADIAFHRAEAALEAGPFAEAAAYFGASRRGADLARAGLAHAKAGDAVKARFFANRAVAAAQREKGDRGELFARAARARVHQATGLPLAAAPDLRWLVKNAPVSPEGRAAADALEAMKQPISTQERLEIVDAMVASGGAADALPEIDALAAGAKLPPAEIQHRRATALYKARDWDAASKALLEAAATPTARQAEQLHLAARALARANRDAEAIQRYLEVATKFRTTPWGERSSFYAARLSMQIGQYQEAAQQYDRFLKAYPRSEHKADALYERALATLSSGDPRGAERQLAALAGRASADEAAKLRQLQGLAALRAGDREGAVRAWTEVMRERPLSWAALLARSRLAAEGAPVPPLLEPPASRAAAPLDVVLPDVPALLASVGLDGDAEGWLAANEQEATAAYPGREGEALCAMYGMLSRAKRRYRVGSQAVAYAALKRAPSATERWAWECVYPAPYLPSVRALEVEHGLPRGILHALMRQESAFDPVVVSPARAVGLMQLMPSTAERAAREMGFGAEGAVGRPGAPNVDMGLSLSQLTSPDVNLRLGGFYIAKLHRMFHGSLPLAAAAYNAGPQAVSHWIEVGADRDTDLWVARIPYDETRNYTGRVLANLARYQWLEGGDAAVEMVPLEIPIDARAPADAY